MKFLDDGTLECSAVVANSRMNRERGAVGVNSYEKDIGLDPISFLVDRLRKEETTSWLDLCCGRGIALVQTAEALQSRDLAANVAFHGVDLVDLFDQIPPEITSVVLESASLHQWNATRAFDLITCVHGLHYVGDKLSLIERAASWLTIDGLFLANLDLTNLRLTGGQVLGRAFTKRLGACSLRYNRHRHLISCVGRKKVAFGYRYVGADDSAGPNYSGQEAVDSYYEPLG
jgi:SAM-dependent methyltransferase